MCSQGLFQATEEPGQAEYQGPKLWSSTVLNRLEEQEVALQSSGVRPSDSGWKKPGETPLLSTRNTVLLPKCSALMRFRGAKGLHCSQSQKGSMTRPTARFPGPGEGRPSTTNIYGVPAPCLVQGKSLICIGSLGLQHEAKSSVLSSLLVSEPHLDRSARVEPVATTRFNPRLYHSSTHGAFGDRINHT